MLTIYEKHIKSKSALVLNVIKKNHQLNDHLEEIFNDLDSLPLPKYVYWINLLINSIRKEYKDINKILDEAFLEKELHQTQFDRGLIVGTSGLEYYINRLIDSVNEKQPIDPYPLDIITLDTDPDHITTIQSSLESLNEISEKFTSLLQDNLFRIVPFNSKYLSNFTDKSLPGVIFISDCAFPFSDRLMTLEHIIHEACHVKLNNMHSIYKVFNNNTILLDSPFRADKRPFEGILHGTFVYCYLVEYWYHADRNAERFVSACHLAKEGLRVLTSHQEHFTEYGLNLFQSMKEKVSKYGEDVYV